MRHTLLLKSILEKAYEVKNEFHGEQLCTLHLAAAVADFCNTDYTGFALSDTNYPSVRFEEERLRYIFSKEVRGESFLKKCLSYNWENRGHGNVFDITKCENIAALHGDDILSVDVVFLCVLKELKKTHSTFVHSVIESDEDVLALLLEVDTNIYDYVIDKIENICYALREKSSRAAAIRDWKPAKKFADPDELSALLFGKIGRQISDNSVTIKIPKFFGAADLKVSIHRVGNRYYIHDNGCAVRHLSRRTKDKKKCERALKKVCHDCHIDKGSITGSFINAFQFVYYLKMLVLIAHADLYYSKAERPLYPKEIDYTYADRTQADPIDVNALTGELKKSVWFHYDENEGLSCGADMLYSLFSTRPSFLIETLQNGHIRISDRRKGKYEGEIFEAFYWSNDDISLYGKFISKIAYRFCAEFDGRDIYLTDESENFYKAIFKFFNLAVLLSEFGHDIALQKIMSKSKENE